MLSSWRPGHGPLDVLELKGANVSVHSAAGAERSRLVMQRMSGKSKRLGVWQGLTDASSGRARSRRRRPEETPTVTFAH